MGLNQTYHVLLIEIVNISQSVIILLVYLDEKCYRIHLHVGLSTGRVGSGLGLIRNRPV